MNVGPPPHTSPASGDDRSPCLVASYLVASLGSSSVTIFHLAGQVMKVASWRIREADKNRDVADAGRCTRRDRDGDDRSQHIGGHGTAWESGGPAVTRAVVEAVEDEVERERELGVVIAWSEGAASRRRQDRHHGVAWNTRWPGPQGAGQYAAGGGQPART